MSTRKTAALAWSLGAALLLATQVEAQENSAKARNKLDETPVLNTDPANPARPRVAEEVPARIAAEAPPGVVDESGVEARPQRAEDPLGLYRASDIIGMPLKSSDGQMIGEIKDLVLDARSDEVQYFLVDSVAALRTEGMLILPFTIIHEPVLAHRVRPVEFFTVDLAIDRFRRAPTITVAQFRALKDRDVFVDVDRYYNVDRRIQRGLRPGDRDRGRDRDRDRGQDRDADRDNRRDRDRDADRPRSRGDRPDRPEARPRGDNPRDADRPRPRTEQPDQPSTDQPRTEQPAQPPSGDKPATTRPRGETTKPSETSPRTE